MQYCSTRDSSIRLNATEAVMKGLSREGGLLTPVEIPRLSSEMLNELLDCSYQERVARIMALYLTDYTLEELRSIASEAYGDGKFDTNQIAPVYNIDTATGCLELWHGPTAAFKDMALQVLPRLLSTALQKSGERKTAYVLAATSGDTGKAAMEGFANVPQTRIVVFYPAGGVSPIQELQMITQKGNNVGVCAIKGNFDDVQSGVKHIFTDDKMRDTLSIHEHFLTSANSINWGRILPQMVYYISAYCDLVREGCLSMGDPVNFCVPTGNFGNILAAYYAKCMGLPVKKLICASNCNDVLTEFLRTGTYNRNRPFHITMSPSMDILVSSNLERLLYELSGRNAREVRSYMEELSAQGVYRVSDKIRAVVNENFWGGSCDEAHTAATIKDYYYTKNYLIDPHTAVAANVIEQYRQETGDTTYTVLVSTASPYKFCDHVLSAIGLNPLGDGLSLLEQLHETAKVPIPKGLAELKGQPRRFDLVAEKEDMGRVVCNYLNQ